MRYTLNEYSYRPQTPEDAMPVPSAYCEVNGMPIAYEQVAVNLALEHASKQDDKLTDVCGTLYGDDGLVGIFGVDVFVDGLGRYGGFANDDTPGPRELYEMEKFAAPETHK